jgi:hypothetical protein
MRGLLSAVPSRTTDAALVSTISCMPSTAEPATASATSCTPTALDPAVRSTRLSLTASHTTDAAKCPFASSCAAMLSDSTG